MSPSLTISLVGVAITLAAILVQLGRVLQRADQNETSLKELKDQREKELKPQSVSSPFLVEFAEPSAGAGFQSRRWS